MAAALKVSPVELLEMAISPEAPEVPLTRARRAPLASVMTLAVTPIFWLLMAAARPLRVLSVEVDGHGRRRTASHGDLEAARGNRRGAGSNRVRVVGRGRRGRVDHDRVRSSRRRRIGGGRKQARVRGSRRQGIDRAGGVAQRADRRSQAFMSVWMLFRAEDWFWTVVCWL